jgi:CubicO group peptidase (beta-lactamase class C family)
VAWAELETLFTSALDQGIAPAIEFCVLQDGAVLWHHSDGVARKVPDHRSLGAGTTFDLASLTKPLVGAALAHAFVDDGLLTFGMPVQQILPDAPAGVTLAHLLSHSSGYPAWLPFYEDRADWGTVQTRREILCDATQTGLVAKPGAAHAYSDVGFLVLCRLLEKLAGDRIDRIWQRRVCDRAGWEGLTWGSADAAATELCPVRARVIEGDVHDLNAAALGGFSTHAGLFGKALVLAQAGWDFLCGSRGEGPLASPALAYAWRHRGAGSHWLGWDGVTAGVSSTGSRWESLGMGHLGYTGTSMWIAPGRNVVVVLLTNRVHPSVGEHRIRQLRPAVHEAVVQTLVDLGRW